MKFNWGTGIFLFYGLFATSLVFQVIKSTGYDNSLVVDNYYDEDLAYQSRYEQLSNSAGLTQKLTIGYLEQENLLRLAFPGDIGEITGNIRFYRPNDKKQDFSVSVQTKADKVMEITAKAFPSPGRWKVEVEWNAGGKDYYDEQAVDIAAKEGL